MNQVYRVLGGREEELDLGNRRIVTQLSTPEKPAPFEVTTEELALLHDRELVEDGFQEVRLGSGRTALRPKYRGVDRGLGARFSLTPPGPEPPPSGKKRKGGD